MSSARASTWPKWARGPGPIWGLLKSSLNLIGILISHIVILLYFTILYLAQTWSVFDLPAES
jgi:hypothetical protein